MTPSRSDRPALRLAAASLALVLAGTLSCGGRAARKDTTALQADSGAVAESPNARDLPHAPAPAKTPLPTDANIVAAIALDDSAEMAVGKLAAASAGNPDVRDFGSQLAHDHLTAQLRLEAIARAQGIAPAPPPSSDSVKARIAAQRDTLSRLRGVAFDQRFVAMEAANHVQALRNFDLFAGATRDSALRNYLNVTAKRLADHLTRARKLAAETGTPAR